MSLITQIKEGDSKAFKEVYDLYHHALNNFILKKTNSDYLAEEVVQITFFKLWKYRSSLNETIPINTQIYRIARTILINQLKKEQYAKEYQFSIGNKTTIYEHVAEDIFYNETLTKLKALIEQLPPIRKKVFELSRINQLTYGEISEELDVSTKTVENHINLALKFIRPHFKLLIFLTLFFR